MSLDSTVLGLYKNIAYTTQLDLNLYAYETGSTPPDRSFLTEALRWIQSIHSQYLPVMERGTDIRAVLARDPDFGSSLVILRRKVDQIEQRIKPLLASLPPLSQSVATAPDTIQHNLTMLKDAINRDDIGGIRASIQLLPQDIQANLFRGIWEVSGCPRGIHPDFGRAAFCHLDTLASPQEKKKQAFELAVLVKMAEQLKASDEKGALASLSLLSPSCQKKVFEHTWIVMGRPKGIHDNYGEVGFRGTERRIQVPIAKKEEAVLSAFKTLIASYSPPAHATPAAAMVSSHAAALSPLDQQISILQQRASRDGFLSFYNDTLDPVTGFMGNFHPCTIEFSGLVFTGCSEAVFQAGKFEDRTVKARFLTLDGDAAFHLGRDRSLTLTKGWDQKKDAVMMNVLRAKFGQNPHLKQLLLATGSAYLIEHNPVVGRDNYWSDNYDGTGKNMLGVMLMRLRAEYGGTGEVPKPTSCYQAFGHPLPGTSVQVTGTMSSPSGTQYVCALPGCLNPPYVDTRTSQVFKFCGRSHGQQYVAMHGTEPCALPGCNSPRFQHPDKRIEECCGRTHGIALQALRAGKP